MPILNFCAFVACFFLTVSGNVLQAGEVMQLNMLKNPGFEEGKKTPSFWPLKALSLTPKFSRDETVFHLWKASLKYANANPQIYQLTAQPVRLTPGRRYELSAWIKTENLGGAKAAGATICLGYSDAKGNYVDGGPHPGGLKDTINWRKLTAYSGPVPENVVAGDFTCYVMKNQQHNNVLTGKAWWDDVCLRPVSFFATMLKPSYKRMITDASSEVEYELECWPQDYGLSFEGTCVEFKVLDKEGKSVFIRQFDIKEQLSRVSFDMGKLPSGRYEIVSSFKVKKSGQELWEWRHDVNRVCDSKFVREVYIDAYGRLIRNGKPMFPLGVYVRKAPVEKVREIGFNCFMSYDDLSVADMDKAALAGLSVIYSLKDFYSRIWYCPDNIRNIDDEVPAILQKVEKYKNHPALIAWYVNDELGPDSLLQHRAHYEALNAADRDHPAWSVHYRKDEISMLTDSCDVIGMDTYPVCDLPLARVGDDAKETLNQVRYSRPLWSVLQIFDQTVYGKKDSRAPTLAEMRCMSWQAICEGARGLVYFSLHDMLRSPKSAKHLEVNVKQMVSEISEYTDILLSVEKCPEIKVTAGKWFRWTARKFGNKIYIFTVSDASSAGEVKFTIAAKVKNVQAVSLGKKGGVDVKIVNDSWVDALQMMQVKIYIVTII